MTTKAKITNEQIIQNLTKYLKLKEEVEQLERKLKEDLKKREQKDRNQEEEILAKMEKELQLTQS